MAKDKRKERNIGYSRLISAGVNTVKRSKRTEWALELVPEEHDGEKNRKISDLLLGMVGRYGVCLKQMLDHDAKYPDGMMYFGVEWKHRVPTYVQFKNALDRFGDMGYERRLARMEEEILFNARYSEMEQIAESGVIDDNERKRFAMKGVLGSMLVKRRKLRGDDVSDEQALVNRAVASIGTFAGVSNQRLLAVIERLEEMERMEGLKQAETITLEARDVTL